MTYSLKDKGECTLLGSATVWVCENTSRSCIEKYYYIALSPLQPFPKHNGTYQASVYSNHDIYLFMHENEIIVAIMQAESDHDS